MNEKMRYSEPDPATRADLALVLAGGDGLTAAETLIGVVRTDPDRAWLEDTCLAIARDHASENLRGVAVTCLGHIARLFGEIDRDKVMPALAELAQQPGMAGRVEDARDDIDMFA